MKVLVIGTGFLGKCIVEQFKIKNFDVFNTNFQNLKKKQIFLDITKIGTVEKVVKKIEPQLIINCAGSTSVDFLESHPDLGFSINSYGPENLASICNKNKIRLIHISTDSVFDGKNGSYSEEDIPNPINVYSKSKLLGEELVSKNLHNHVNVRTNFFGYNIEGKFLLNTILRTLSENKHFTGFHDVFFNPLEISNLSKMIVELSQKEVTGTINLSSDQIISKYEFALEVAKTFDLNLDLIYKSSVEDFKFIAKRPKNTSLLNSKAKKIMSTKIFSVKESLNRIKKENESMNF